MTELSGLHNTGYADQDCRTAGPGRVATMEWRQATACSCCSRTSVDQTVVQAGEHGLGRAGRDNGPTDAPRAFRTVAPGPTPWRQERPAASWRQAKKPNTRCYGSSCLLRGAHSGCAMYRTHRKAVPSKSRQGTCQAHGEQACDLGVPCGAGRVKLRQLYWPCWRAAVWEHSRKGAIAVWDTGSAPLPPLGRCLDLFRKSWERLARQLRKYRMD